MTEDVEVMTWWQSQDCFDQEEMGQHTVKMDRVGNGREERWLLDQPIVPLALRSSWQNCHAVRVAGVAVEDIGESRVRPVDVDIGVIEGPHDNSALTRNDLSLSDVDRQGVDSGLERA